MTTIKHFGLVTAVISDRDRRVELRLRQPADNRHGLGKGHVDWCLSWALSVLADYRQQGYTLSIEAASA